MKKADNYIFVSYARANSDRVIPIIEDLKKNGYNVWYDREISVGTEWPDFLENQILNCSCFLVFISKAAVDSINVRNEINFAITQNKNIFVFFLDETELKYGLGLQIGNKQSFLAYKHTSYEAMLKELISAEILQSCRESGHEEFIASDGFQPSLKKLINDALDALQEAFISLKGNPSSAILDVIIGEEEKLKELLNKIQSPARSKYLTHLSKIDLFLSALKMQFANLQPAMLSYQMMFIDTYLSQILPEIESMRQIDI